MVAPAPQESRARLRWEIAIVLAVGLGQSAVYSIVNLVNRLTLDTPLGQQTTTLNPSRDEREVFDLVYQLLSIGFGLVPVLLVGYLLWRPDRPHLRRLGVTFDRPGRDALAGLLLVAIIAVPGIAIYVLGRLLGFGVAVDPAGLGAHWWTVPVLVLSAARAALQEELVVLGYLFARLGDLGWGRWPIIVGSALLRGSYHLYQGFGGFIANALMGLLFGWWFARTGRVWPFVIAHFVVDAVVFIGAPWAFATFPDLFGVPAS